MSKPILSVHTVAEATSIVSLLSRHGISGCITTDAPHTTSTPQRIYQVSVPLEESKRAKAVLASSSWRLLVRKKQPQPDKN